MENERKKLETGTLIELSKESVEEDSSKVRGREETPTLHQDPVGARVTTKRRFYYINCISTGSL